MASIDARLKRQINGDIVYIALQHVDAAAQNPDISFLLAPLNLMA